MSENRLCSEKLEKLSNLMHSVDFNHLCAPMPIPGEGNTRLCLALALIAVLDWSWSSDISWGLYADLYFSRIVGCLACYLGYVRIPHFS